MLEAVYRMLSLLGTLLEAVPLGTNPGLRRLLRMPVSGRLLGSRGALFPGLAACGLSERALRRARAVLGPGDGTSAPLLGAELGWRPRRAAGSPTRTAALVPSRPA